MDLVRVSVRLFGSFRGFSTDPEVSFEVPRGTPVSALRQHLAAALRRGCTTFDEALLDVSVLADDDRVLDDDQRLDGERASLALLPPVCGG